MKSAIKKLWIIAIMAVITFSACPSLKPIPVAVPEPVKEDTVEKAPEDVQKPVPKSIVEMAQINTGTFMMGSPVTEPDRFNDEARHSVTLTKNFYMGKYLVTQAQWKAVTGKTIEQQQALDSTSETDFGRGADYPVYFVNWYEVVEFCNKLSVMEGLDPVYSLNDKTDTNEWGEQGEAWNSIKMDMDKNGYRLPTEAEWEYACRAGTTTAYNTGDKVSDNIGWNKNNSDKKTYEVGLKAANNLGLYDMNGNLYEWCWDWYGKDYYSSSPKNDPVGPEAGASRVKRGGCLIHEDNYMRSAFRYDSAPSDRYYSSGFRLVRS
jgi:formylglycine-generating enzyme required for sulfatase activity